jgi:glyoxylase-like metal-dependent hydrolase (beta-lactamase superfamily II)
MKLRAPGSLFLLAGLLAAPCGAAGQTIAPEEVASGVWAAPTPGGANVGWFLQGDGVVAVDSGANDEVGRAIVDQIQKTTGKKPRYLVITHAHRDHAGGVAAFAAAGAQVVTSEKSAPGILALLELAARSAGAGKAASNPFVMTVSDRSLLVGGTGRRAEIYYLGAAHTQGDLVVLLSDGVLFSGDVAVNGVVPFLRSEDVDPQGWEKVLARLAAIKIDKMVPGHGKIGPTQGISDTAAYIRGVLDICQRLLMAGVPEPHWTGAIRAPENMIQNVPISNDHIENVNAVCRREKAARETAGRQSPAPAAPPAPTPKTP